MPEFRRCNMTLAVTLVTLLLTLGSCGSSRRTSVTHRRGTAAELVTMAYTNDIGKRLVKEAKGWLGSPYRYGGHGRNGTDCSGLVMEVYSRTLGINLPRTSADQCDFATDIKREALRNGDLIFFATGSGRRVSHVGIYIGDNRMIHASTSRGVMVSDITDGYWKRNYVASGRILRDAAKRSNPGRYTDPLYDPVPGGDNPVQSLPEVTPAVSYELLDEILNRKIDSVYNNYLD